jgi:hypothetical protein
MHIKTITFSREPSLFTEGLVYEASHITMDDGTFYSAVRTGGPRMGFLWEAYFALGPTGMPLWAHGVDRVGVWGKRFNEEFTRQIEGAFRQHQLDLLGLGEAPAGEQLDLFQPGK